MSLSVEQFLDEYPEFAHTKPRLIQNKIDAAYSDHESTLWDKHRDRAVGLMVAHVLTCRIAQTSEIVGTATGIAAGRGGQGLTQKGDNDLNSSHYGQQYLRLKRTIPTTGFSE